MAVILLNLRNVPDDEAEEIRDLLTRHCIDFYETPPSRWGISVGAIWLRDDGQRKEARRLLGEYQQQRQASAREAHRRLKLEGRAETVIDRLRTQPFRALVYLGVVALILYLSIKPFLDLGL